MIPVLSVISSKSNIGKTTVLCDIIRELKLRGYRVATIKHDVHGFDIDHPGKDTFLHAEAGADTIVISSPKKMAIIENVRSEYSLDDIINKIKNVDIILTEGYKTENKPKIEVFRKEISSKLFSKDEELFAIVSDTKTHKNIPHFNFSEIHGLVDLIETTISK